MRLLERPPQAEMTFARLMYDAANSYALRGGGWRADWPEAEIHFMQGVRRLTNVDGAEEGKLLRLTDPDLFEYPWLYAVEVGGWYLSPEEAKQLREYLLRGGFLVLDDFHGSYQWQVFMHSMRLVFPDRPVVDIPESDEIMRVIYELDQSTQIPGIRPLMSGRTWEQDGVKPNWRGIYDDKGRLMVVINHNMDLGDAWEHADWPQYPEPLTALAYRFGINYLIYAMTR